MKKFFSLVLALAMALSLTTIAWGATAADATELQAAIDAATTGDNTITLTGDITGDVLIVQKAGVNIVIDGAKSATENYKFSGTIKIDGDARFFDAETLTIKNIDFTTGDSSRTFIDANKSHTGKAYNYAHNVTVQDCTFTATAANNEVVATRFRQANNVKMIGCDVDGLHSAMWATGTSTIVVDDLTATNCVEGGLSVGSSTSVTVKNSIIESDSAKGYGIRADGDVEATLTVENCEVEAFIPVVVRNTSKEYTVELSGNNDLTATNTDGYEVAVAKGKYEANGALEQPDVSYTLKNTGTPVQTSQVGFVVNGTNYDTLTAAVAAAADGDTVVMMANSAEDITLTKVITIDTNGFAYTGTLKAPTGYQILKDTNNVYYVVPAVTMGDKFDLYLADKNMNTMLALEVPSVAGLSFTEVKANTYKDGSGNVAYIVANNGEYYVKTSTPYTTSYAVTEAGETDVLYYVNVGSAGAGYYAYEASVTAFNKFSTYDKCGCVTGTPAATDVYFQTEDGTVYKAKASVEADATKNYLLNGKIVTAGAEQTVVDHKFVASGYKYDTTYKVNVPTSALCTKCLMTSTTIYKDGKVPAGLKFYELYEGNTETGYSVIAEASAPSVGGTTDVKVESADTFDAGIAMYVGMSVMAAAGSVVVLKKRED